MSFEDCNTELRYLDQSQQVTLPSGDPMTVTVAEGGLLSGEVSRADEAPISRWCADIRSSELGLYAYNGGAGRRTPQARRRWGP